MKKTKVKKVNKCSQKTLTRKELRKEKRKLKKNVKCRHYMERFRKLNSKSEDIIDDDGETKPQKKKTETAKKKEKKKTKDDKLKKEQERQRKRGFILANKEEEKTIKRLEKQLKLNKRKSTGKLPKAFVDDGLDYLLEACDSSKLAAAAVLDESVEENSDQDVSSDMDENEDEENMDVEDETEDEEEKEVEEEEEKVEEEKEEEEEEKVEEEEEEEKEAEEAIMSDVVEKLEDKDETREDIYGRTKDSKGNIIRAYVPPARRTENGEGLIRLERKVKGLLNRLSESNLHFVCAQLVNFYMSNSHNDMNETLTKLISESLIGPTITPERLVLEHAVLVAVLHANVGTEVGAFFLQNFVQKFNELYSKTDLAKAETKYLDNYVLFICHLYSFNVTDSSLIFEIMNEFAESFEVKDIELILAVLRSVGFGLRKDDPSALKSIIFKIQTKAPKTSDSSRVKFMLEILMAIRNNNVKKIPNYDPDYLNHLKKIIKNFLSPGASMSPLKIGFKDLLEAETKGRWWLFGSAWAGRDDDDDDEKNERKKQENNFTDEMLELARKMRMNTDVRKNIFCVVMSADDFVDGFEKLVKLKDHKEREVIFVLLECALQEPVFNPYYSQLTCKLSRFDRKYRMAAQFSLWDKFKVLHSLTKNQINNLAEFTKYLIVNGALSLAVLKVIEFADIDSTVVKFLKLVLTDIVCGEPEMTEKCFYAIAGYPKLKLFREGLSLFMKHFMLKSAKKKQDPNYELLKTRVNSMDSILSGDNRLLFL